MPSSSDSDDDRRKSNQDKKFHINSSVNPVLWDGENWPFYKKAMIVAFQRDLLEQIATGKVKENDQWSQDEKDEHTKKQAKIQMLIMGSLKTTLAQQWMDQKNGTDMWAELCKIYEGKNNDATKAKKVYRLQGPDSSAHECKDWEKNAFGNNQGSKKKGSSSGNQKDGNNKLAGDSTKKKTPKTEIECFNCGVKGHYKSYCPDLEEKLGAKKNEQAKMARIGEKSVEEVTSQNADEVVDLAHKRDVVVGEVVKRVAKNYDPSRWYFDSGTNAHIVTSKEYFTVLNSMEDSDWNPTISGFADGVPAAGCNLFSPGQALEQGFKMSWDQEAMIFGMSKDDTEVIWTKHDHRLWTFDVHNIGGVKVNSKKTAAVKKRVLANFAVTDGVEDLDVWHTRLGHTCPEYIRLMVDRGMAKGIMLKKRGKMDCADCHFGKQRRKTFRKKLERNIEKVNDMIFADLLIPGLHNGTQYSAVLVLMDGFSRFVTTYLLKSKTEGEVNEYMKQYVAWAERQHGRRVDTVVTRQWCAETHDHDDEVIGLVKEVLTDKGKEFCNNTIERWYADKGIVHTKVGPKSSQLNLVGRTHQTLISMVKTMMHDSGLPRSFWTHALQTAVYIKNRVFCKGAGRTPYEMVYGTKPDLHHLRTFGSLVYCHAPVAKRTKLAVNCKVGFLIGYQEDVVGCQVYFPTEHQKGFVADVKVNESIKYKDRYGSTFKTKDLRNTQSVMQIQFADSVREDSNVGMVSVAESEELDAERAALWNEMVQNSVLPTFEGAPSSMPSSKPTDGDQEVWQDLLENCSMPNNELALVQTQEGEDEASTEDHENEDENRDHDGDFDDVQVESDDDADASASEHDYCANLTVIITSQTT
ncbi:Integrase catalytic core protein [Phytophthora palmivora]|uniref:Integrase catalytic core protein n=1 Tax=Phytophthora palmivora TaxID=4796 RepID=A0A2P4YIF2_9STRA|nr:Integrase catalytic core protein [Phytophthora palmivora]